IGTSRLSLLSCRQAFTELEVLTLDIGRRSRGFARVWGGFRERVRWVERVDEYPRTALAACRSRGRPAGLVGDVQPSGPACQPGPPLPHAAPPERATDPRRGPGRLAPLPPLAG